MPKGELYIGNLNKDATQREIENVFKRHGKIKRCEVKNKGYGPVYAFIEFEDERDAEDALSSENGKDMCGASMVVEYTKGKGDRRERRDDRYGYGRNGFSRSGGAGGRGGRSLECYECGERGHFARDCRNKRYGGRRRDRSRDRSRSRDRRRDRSRDRSRDRRDRSKDKSRERSRDKSRDRSREKSNVKSRERTRSPDEKRSNKSRTRSRSIRHSRSQTPVSTKRSRSPSFDQNGNDNSMTNDD